MAEFAVYGKGGIGKSTIAANLSAALALAGKKVLQIGCDPKHDSTRLLLHGRRITTVLDYLKETSPDKCRLADVVHQGVFGVHCVEAGGPEPGVGCAGRGILTTFELLERLGVKSRSYDAVVYDVLGDVVCGGFAVPIRRDYAEKVYIISSGEFMSIYAANNILRGLKNYDGDYGRAGGVILNSRGLGEEDIRVRCFCEAVGLPLLECFGRSDLFSQSEAQGRCLVEAFPQSPEAGKFKNLARFIFSPHELYPARPLSDQELEEKILGRTEAPSFVSVPPETGADQDTETVKTEDREKPSYFSKSLVNREPLYGCAFSGAMSITTQIGSSVSIAHGPESCAHITYQSITSLSRRFLLERGIVLPYVSAPPVISSEMNEGVMIFGGLEELRKKISQIKAEKPEVIFILTTCPAGIIGDDIRAVLDLQDKQTKIVPILADGNIAGDYLQGIIMAYMEIGKALIDRNLEPEDNTVNMVAEKSETNALAESFAFGEEIFGALGLTLNCRFICQSSPEEIRRFKKGRLNILAWGDYMGRAVRSFLENEYGAEFFDDPLPVGFQKSREWVRKLGAYFNKSDKETDAVIADFEKPYRQGIEKLKPHLAGKRLMVITYNQDIDWILGAALDLSMEIAFVGILDYSQDNNFKTVFAGRIGELRVSYDKAKRREDITRIRPDLYLTNYGSQDQELAAFADTIPLSPPAGFLSGLKLAERWSGIIKMNLKEGWRDDEFLYRKYRA
ncbi:MAG: AAA family ATPase [Spirochaetaceae bacterium]|jgi:nitrogenase iron protein|nr:AAA family ATPase [Spirochaetaceae bacterium]